MKKSLIKMIALILAVVMFAQTSMSDYERIAEAKIGDNVIKLPTASPKPTSTPEPTPEPSPTPIPTPTKVPTNAKGYVSDLRLYKSEQGKASETVAKANSEGYQLFFNGSTPVDLNEYTDRDNIYIGYKTTDDENQAVRSIKMLEMGHGYEWYDYQKVAEGQMEKIEPLAADIKIASEEFRENLSKGSRAAKLAKDYLNYLYFTYDPDRVNYSNDETYSTLEQLIADNTYYRNSEEKKTYLGDYLSSGEVDTNLIKKIIVQANGGSVSAVYAQLSLAISDIDETWVERIDDTETYNLENPTTSQNNINDRMYYVYSVEMLDVLRDFYAGYNKAEERKKGNGEVGAADIDSDSEKPDAGNVQEIIDSSQEDAAGDIIFEAAYGMLNTFNVGDKKAGDYIIGLASDKYTKKADYRKLYPLVEALTDGQFGIIKIVGLANMALNLNHSDEFFAELENNKADVLAAIKKATGGETKACIWLGVNTEFFERKVALTSAAERERKASEVYTELTKAGNFYDNMNLAFMYIGMACSVAAVVTGCVYIGLLIAGSKLTVWAACASVVGSGVAGSIFGVLGCFMVAVGYITLAALIICALVYFGYWLYDELTDDEKEDYYKMPTEIYDIDFVREDNKKVSKYIKYESVNNSRGKPQDINADDGKRWNLLYYTKHADYGSPVSVNQANQVFARTVESVNTPAGFVPVTGFGDNSAANLNSYVRKDHAKSIYLHYATKDEIDGTVYADEEEVPEDDAANVSKSAFAGVQVNEGEPVKIKKGEKYLWNIMISHENLESAAKAGIKKNPGYKVYDRNLTPGNGYTYLGYSSTTVKKDAITDIRIVPNYNGVDNISFGSASYSCAGTLPDGSGLVYTRYSSAGTPIIDTFFTSETLLGPESPYEPVNLLCGGDAYDINRNIIKKAQDDTLKFVTDSGNSTPLYLYFKPSVAYTSGEKYISGIQFVTEYKGKRSRSASEVMSELGLTALSDNLAGNMSYLSSYEIHYWAQKTKITYNYSGHNVYMCYSPTYNPYRAIYDVSLYTATPRLSKLPITIAGTKGNYIAGETTVVTNKTLHLAGMFTLGDDMDYESAKAYNASEDVYISSARAYNDRLLDAMALVGRENAHINAPELYDKPHYHMQSLKLESNITYAESNWRLQGLYQLGHVQGMSPLKVSDVVVNKSAKIPAGMHSVQRFNTATNTGAINVALTSKSTSSNARFMYLRGEKSAKGKYISDITVLKYERPKDTEEHTYTSEEIKEMGKSADDSCIIGLSSRVDGEVLNYNLSIRQDDAWYRDPEANNIEASYMGVTRTSDPNRAITGLIIYKSPGPKPAMRIKIDGIEYLRAGDSFGDCYLYYSKSPGAAPGAPLENVSFEEIAVIDGTTTVPSISVDSEGKGSYTNDYASLNGYFHTKTDLSNCVVSDITLVTGRTREEAADIVLKSFGASAAFITDSSIVLNGSFESEIEEARVSGAISEAMKRGYCYVEKTPLNANTKAERPVYLAYKLCSAEYLGLDEEADMYDDEENEEEDDWFDEDWDFDFGDDWDDDEDEDLDWLDIEIDDTIEEDLVIRDIICRVGKYPEEEIVIGNKTYKLASNISLNYKTEGKGIYLYYTTDTAGALYAPVTGFTICSGNSVPDRDDGAHNYGRWERLLDEFGNEVNINDGVIEWTNEGSLFDKHPVIKDTRLFMFIQRYGGNVKRSAVINRGVMKSTFDIGELYYE